jgi:hypothetical protein
MISHVGQPKVMIQTEEDTLVLQVGVGRRIANPIPFRALIVEMLLTIAAGRKYQNGEESHRIGISGEQS